ncbi:MAG: hypothetical protein KIT46_05260 [Anaerolineales bacterium]|nr:hypothetical protein [Anaerolineales bacterium]MCW5855441.1 hypothetical protein [Anaerolineales bacterium]
MADQKVSASFRDPSGFVFTRQNQLYRQVNKSYQADYELLHETGLYAELTSAGLLVSHEEVSIAPAEKSLAYKVLQPERIPFISYAYEWSFSQLKDAALLTLDLQKRALARGLWLKDATSANIQFHHGHPILIDSLSFEAYPEGQPWTAYRQFCQHFLAPLALMALVDVRLSQMLRIQLDGIDLELCSRLLPRGTRFNLGLLFHIHLHASAQKRYAGRSTSEAATRASVSKMALLGMVDQLERTIAKLQWKPIGSAWGNYYAETNYSNAAETHKGELVEKYLKKIKPKSVWDLGANNGLYSRIAARLGAFTVSQDYDPAAVEQNYLRARAEHETNLHPLLIDLANPSPALGWANQEREALSQRGAPDALMALALVHHLAIGNNLPLERIAEFFASLAPWLIIEFVPKSDSQVKRLLASRKDIFDDYTLEGFTKAFSKTFKIETQTSVTESERTLFLLKRK